MSKRDTFLDLVCSQRGHIRTIIAVIIMAGCMLLFSTFFVDPSSDWFPIYVIDVFLVGTSFVAFTTAYWYCIRREMDEE